MMAIDYERLMALDIPEIEQSYSEKDCILYALGCGLCHDPLDKEQLAFVYEAGLKVLPTMANVLAASPFWLRDLDTGIDFNKVVHGEQAMTLHRPLATNATVIGKTRILDLVDKGAGKGAIVYAEHALRDKATNEQIATSLQTIFCRGDGGFGGPVEAKNEAKNVVRRASSPLPVRNADLVCDLPTRPEMALLYRLSGDLNPLHADPAFAARAGFPRPILHGLASFAVAGHALLKALCGYDPRRLKSLSGRFTAPVFPGETIRTEIWREGESVRFRARAVERNSIVIDQGEAAIA